MKQLKGIRAVTFDVGSTLIEPWPSVGYVYAEVAAEHGHGNISADELDRRFRAAFRRCGGLVNTRAEWAQIVDETFAGLIPQPPSYTFFPMLYERFAAAGPWRVFEDVLPTLSSLRQRGLKLGVISNWDDRLRPLLNSLQLADQFDCVVVSCEVGDSKPAFVMFHAAVEQLGVPADSILHVGDSFEMDVQGARTAGLKAMQISRDMSRPGGIKSLLDLLALL